MKAAQDLPGQRLFQYEGDDGAPHEVTSTDVNAYLREISGRGITAKDFRTWAGTVLAATALSAFEAVDRMPQPSAMCAPPSSKWPSASATRRPSAANATSIPKLVETYLDRSLALKITRVGLAGLSAGEGAVLLFLHKGLGKRAKRSGAPPKRQSSNRVALFRRRRIGQKASTGSLGPR